MVGQTAAGLAWITQAIKGLATSMPSTHWAQVTQVTPDLLVTLEHDETFTPRPVSANAAGGMQEGQRVLLLRERNRLTIIGSAEAAWTPAVLLNGWTNYGGRFATAAYRRVPGGIMLRGLIRGGTRDQPAFRVPSITAGEQILAGLTYAGTQITPCRISVTSSGDITPSIGANPDTWVSLSGITIPT